MRFLFLSIFFQTNPFSVDKYSFFVAYTYFKMLSKSLNFIQKLIVIQAFFFKLCEQLFISEKFRFTLTFAIRLLLLVRLALLAFIR